MPEGEYLVWMPVIAVERLLARHEEGETFSAVILRLIECGGYSAIIQ